MREAGTPGHGAKADCGATVLEEFRARSSQQSFANLRAGSRCHVEILAQVP
jgi:hypothetical protein